MLGEGDIGFRGDFSTAVRCVRHPRPPSPTGPPLMVGSIGARMLAITLPYVDAWNMWWSQYGNTAAGFSREKSRVDELIEAAGRPVGEVDATAAVLVQLPGGTGRQMGDHDPGADVEPLVGPPSEIADQLRAFEAAGATHVQLCVDPITLASIEQLGDVLAEFRRRQRAELMK